ncbi:MAG: ATP-grasp domain-containing protein [Planctomycetota bacterium]|nr:ATP-grasp domain-containing protein [Planctomycetota bacterium]
MKIAVVYNRESRKVINLFGQPNRERYGLRAIDRVLKALKGGRHQAVAFEGDKDLVDRLEHFMPRVVAGERPGLVFNLSYGIQGQARYAHVPSILEMVGIPYVGSGPLAHSIALDKVVTKMILVQHGISTPQFAVLEHAGAEIPDLTYPVIVKPKHEAVSFGIQVCHDREQVMEAAGKIFEMFGQAVLVEQFIEGREINVGLLGNGVPEALPPVELVFPPDGPTVYSYEDKTHRSGRTIELRCPALIDDELVEQARELARSAFRAVGCFDCSRVDMRLDAEGRLYVLEVNSLPSLGAGGSYVRAAAEVGMDFNGLVNRLVEEASARYFGTPTPPTPGTRTTDPSNAAFASLTRRRDELEARLQSWVNLSSRTADAIGLHAASDELGRVMRTAGLRPVPEYVDERSLLAWETAAGLEGGTLLVSHLDVPVQANLSMQSFRRDPEHLYGEGIGTSRAALVMIEFALRALRSARQLRKLPLGVAVYLDEGRDARYSAEKLRQLMGRAKRVLVLRPGATGDKVVTARRGQRRYRLRVDGTPLRPGRITKREEPLVWLGRRLERISALSSREKRVSVSVSELMTSAFPMLLPHRLSSAVLMTYTDPRAADEAEDQLRDILGKRGMKWDLTQLADRPPMKERRTNKALLNGIKQTAAHWEIPLGAESSVWPSVAGLAPAKTAVLCGVGPVAMNLYTPDECVERISLIQRTLLLTQFLLAVREGG